MPSIEFRVLGLMKVERLVQLRDVELYEIVFEFYRQKMKTARGQIPPDGPLSTSRWSFPTRDQAEQLLLARLTLRGARTHHPETEPLPHARLRV